MNGISTRPEMEFKVGAVRASIWSNPRHTRDGQIFQSHKVIVERTYKDMHGNFKSTGGLELNDIPKAILALKKAYEWLTVKKPEPHPGQGRDQEAIQAEVRIP